MSDAGPPMAGRTAARVKARLARRYAAERRFRAYGRMAIVLAIGMLATLFVSIIGRGHTAFMQAGIRLEIALDPEIVDPDGKRDPDALAAADYQTLATRALAAQFPEVASRNEKRDLHGLLSGGAGEAVRRRVVADPGLIGNTLAIEVPASANVDQVLKGTIRADAPAAERHLTDRQMGWIEALRARGLIGLSFNKTLFTAGDSREPELAGIWGAMVGSFYLMVVTLAISFPIGVAAALYLEEFAPTNRFTDTIEVNINNLAAVPSVVFGLLGLGIFLNVFGLPRSAPLAGGLVLALVVLPTTIIASRAALKAVPPSIREAALGIGASKMQTTLHHVLPLAMPGILTGTIIGMARALGESAPLLMIGMVAFVVDVPQSPLDPSTVLPVQIYLWADSPERAFAERASAAILVLLAFLIAMNALAVILRRKFERRW